MHQRICQRAVRGKYQQAGCCDIEPSNGHPARLPDFRQCFKYRAPSFRVAVRNHLAFGLVVDDVAVRGRDSLQPEPLPVQRDSLLTRYRFTEPGEGGWWRRERVYELVRPLSRDDPALRSALRRYGFVTDAP